MTETIAAIATPTGDGAIALLRISGSQAMSIADTLFRGKEKPSLMEARRLYFGTIVEGREMLDEVLLTVFRAPHSYTGEDVVEISGHGGSLIASRLLKAILTAGARMARPGEFTQRAYLHGKMDLTQAEAIMDVITAQTLRSQRAATEQLAGRLGQEIALLRADMLSAVAHLEAFIDFPEEDITPETGLALRHRLEQSQQQLLRLLATADEGRLLREGISIALCGAPNAGKSSLLNRLLRRDRAIVHALPGTTRDTIEEAASLGGFPFRLIDTAGLRETEDAIEQEGVVRAERLIKAADLCLHLIDAGCDTASIIPLTQDELLVFNKIDLVTDRDQLLVLYPKAIFISCITGEGIDNLITAIVSRVTGQSSTIVEQAPSAVAINARHQACLQRALASLQATMNLLEKNQPAELSAVELHAALQAVGEVVGAAGTEEILGEIFGNFCIGK